MIDRSSLRWNGWGRTDAPDPIAARPEVWAYLRERLGGGDLPLTPTATLEQVTAPPAADGATVAGLAGIVGAAHVSTELRDRVLLSRGRSYPDLLALRSGRLDSAPAAVVRPCSPDEVQALVSWAHDNGVVLVPFGGGSSVVGGVTPVSRNGAPVVALDLARLDRVLSVTPRDGLAVIQAGADGPGVEAQLAEHGLTLGHTPQSFHFSTLGGWIAARGAGQRSNRYGRAEDWLVSADLATPVGPWCTEPFPASAAGPRVGDLVAGSEGLFGVITQATVRVHAAPELKDYRAYVMPSFAAGAEAIRCVVQDDIPVAMLRLSDEAETGFYADFSRLGRKRSAGSRVGAAYLRARGVGDRFCILLLGCEGDARRVREARREAERHIRAAGGIAAGRTPADRWLHGRFDGPYLRDGLLERGVGVDTLETATRWSNLERLHDAVGAALTEAIAREAPEGGRGVVFAHISHSYPDGASLYFTFVFRQRAGAELEQWRAIKRAAGDAIVEHGGTISHHHGVGEDHRPWMAREKDAVSLAVLRAVKQAVDPRGVLNPGKLLP